GDLSDEAMNDELPLDEVTDLIASVEMHRKEIERESGLEASRVYALRRLNEALQQEQEAAQQQGESEVRAAVIAALIAEIKRVTSLSRSAGQRPPQEGGNRPQN